MPWSAKEIRAIKYFGKQHNYQTALSHHPWVYYSYQTDSDDCTVRFRISEVLEAYEKHLIEERRSRQQRYGVL